MDVNHSTTGTPSSGPIEAVIFDIGDVLFSWSFPDTIGLSPKIMKEIMDSPQWYEFEKGNLEQNEMNSIMAKKYSVCSETIAAAFQAARSTLQTEYTLFDTISRIKSSGRKVYLMSNISAPDFKYIQNNSRVDWSLFDDTFISATAHVRKPSMTFFQQVLNSIHIPPNHILFIDDKVENVFSAMSAGMNGIVHKTPADTISQLLNICFDPVERASEWLSRNRGRMVSSTSNGGVFRERFTQLLILEATGDRSLVDLTALQTDGRLGWNFFQDKPFLTTEHYPDDLDTTSIALTTLKDVDSGLAHRVLDEMLKHRNDEKIFQVYFDDGRSRTDPVVCINIVHLFYQYGRGDEAAECLLWIKNILYHRAYIHATPYYATPEAFFYFLGRLIELAEPVREMLGSLFIERLTERSNTQGDSLSLAIRVVAASKADSGLLRLPSVSCDIARLRVLQDSDGSWKEGWFYRFGRTGIRVKNDGFTTVLAIKAIELWRAANKLTPVVCI